MEKKQIKLPKWTVPIMACFMVFAIAAGGIFLADIDDYEEASQGIYNEPVQGSVKIITEDKTKVSNYYYRTQGFTITDTETGQTIRISLGNADDCTYKRTELKGTGRHQSEWTIGYDTIMNKIASQYPDWAQRIVNNTAGKIQFDAIINVFKNGVPAGQISSNGSTEYGTLYDKDNWDQLVKDYPELAHLNKDIKNHYDKLLEILQGEWVLGPDGKWQFKIKKPSPSASPSGSADPNPSPTPPWDENPEFVKWIGKDDPYYATYNYDPTGKFVIGAKFRSGDKTGGIPTDEDITNGYEANKWYGTFDICRRENVSNSWTFKGDVSLTVHTGQYRDVPYDPNDPSKGTYQEEVTYSSSIPRSDTNGIVTRTVRYWYIGEDVIRGRGEPRVYGLKNTITENTVFPGGKHEYTNTEALSIICTANGMDLTAINSYEFKPDDSYHIDWDRAKVYGAAEDFIINGASADVNVSDDYGTRCEKASAAVASLAESHIEPNENIWVRNDEITIEGHTYMSSQYYQFKDFHVNFGEANTAIDIAESDYGMITDEQNGRIPANIANGDYDTTITTIYRREVLAVHDMVNNGPNNKIKDGNDKFGHHYERDNEAVRIHTPTVSPVEVVNPDTGLKWELKDMKNQLLPSVVNPNADYQFLLDGTYKIKFIPETHFEHIGYDDPELVSSLYQKYCQFREVCFPFTVQINGRIYEPTPESVGIYQDVDFACGRKKLPGYTDWIRLPDGAQEVEFYIPTWATEGNDYVVQFRVAPINVVDHKKVDHIEDYTAWDYDWEYLKNISVTIPGHGSSDLYEYVSTYTFTSQVSGIIYDFQAVGIDDKDRFEGYKENNYGHEVSNGMGEISHFPFCPTKQEKRSGIYNRFGNVSVRYSFDGTLTNNWNERNTLPFSLGRSIKYEKEGELRKGNTFAFTVKTIANLGDEDGLLDNSTTGDCIIIKPTFRYISVDGTVNKDIDVYYDVDDSDGKTTHYFVRYGESRDLQNKQEVKIADIRFNGSYYHKTGLYEPDMRKIIQKEMLNPLYKTEEHVALWRYHHDDAEYSRGKTNEFLKTEAAKAGNKDFPDEAYSTDSVYLERKTESQCLSEIVLNSRLRLLTGNVEQLKRNETYQGGELQYLDDRLPNGTSYKVTPEECDLYDIDYWDKHRKSMQTWFGTYWIPNQLYVTDDVFEADADGDGVKEKYDTVRDYAEAKGYIDPSDPIFKKDGYLVVNFAIYTKNNGQDHLVYSGGNADMWGIEGQVDKVQVGDGVPKSPYIDVTVEHGDVAIINLSRSIMDGWSVGFNRIN